MKLDNLTAKLTIVRDRVGRYVVIIFVICVALVFGFLTLKISSYSNNEPNDTQIEERLSTLQTVKLNDEAVQKIEELQDRNISLESLFNNGRDNPFE
jgi:hypothetical protein